MKKYTVLMSVYIKDNPEWVEASINSMLNQTVKPDEILILKDGKLNDDLEETLKKFKSYKDIKIVGFEINRGLGPVLADGVRLAKNELIARMDADDISERDRCEIQLKKFEEDSNIDIIGGAVSEFIGNDIKNVVSNRNMPENNIDIYKYAHKRNPFAHPTVMFKKESVLKAGNYRECELCEDYDLWCRMLINNCKGYNVPKTLVNMRVNEDFYKRRGGIKYLNKMLKFKYSLYKIKFYSLMDLIISISVHIVVALIPSKIRVIIYNRFLRKGNKQ